MEYLLQILLDPNAWLALITLTLLEIVLGIDNIVFIALLVSKLPEHQRDKARIIGLSLAMGTRIALLSTLFVIMKLVSPLFHVGDFGVSGRDMILFFGGLFLIYKAVGELHDLTMGEVEKERRSRWNGYFMVLIQIAVLDIIFSLDSVITAVGMADDLPVMILAIVIAVGIMMVASKWISNFIDKNPTIKVLALAFLILIGVTLIADGLHFHISKAYIYFAMAFSIMVESINIYMSKKAKKEAMLKEKIKLEKERRQNAEKKVKTLTKKIRAQKTTPKRAKNDNNDI